MPAGKDGFRAVSSAVALACEWAVAQPLCLPTALLGADPSNPLMQPSGVSMRGSNVDASQQQQPNAMMPSPSPVSVPLSTRLLFVVRLIQHVHAQLGSW